MNKGYGIALNEWLFDDRIKNELRLLIYISSLTAEAGYCFASNDHFADKFKTSTVTISRQIKKLSDYQYINLFYEKNGHVVTKRKITVNINDNSRYQKCKPPVNKNDNRAVNKNVKENNTSINTTSNNKRGKNKFSYPPEFSEFLDYAIEKESELDLEIDQSKLKAKYLAWKENGWKTGKNTKIKNWKTTLLNTLPYLKKEKSFAKKEKKPNQISDYDKKEQNLLSQLKKLLIQVYGDFTDTDEHKRIIGEIRTELLKVNPGTVKDHYKRIAKYCEQKRGTDKQYLKNLKSLIHGS